MYSISFQCITVAVITHLAIVWRIDHTEECPERRTGFRANEDCRTHAPDLNDFRTNSGN